MSEQGNIALHTTNLHVGYKKGHQTQVLFEPLNIQLIQGELVCFMGSNGVGKTTLIKTLAGIYPPLGGSVTHQYPVAIVLTDKISGGLMTVRDLVTYGRYPHLNRWLTLQDQDHRLIDNALRLVHLQSIENKQLNQLSDGQLQMAMIAKALAQDTNMLLLDEPTAHLDLNNRVEIMNLLRTLAREEGKTILVATHELDLALQTADKIWLATQDQKIVEGMPEDLVLDGTFDRVFQLKGFDLKTGKIAHLPYRKIAVQLAGVGPEFLWTKNALERSGYEITSNASIKILVVIHQEGASFRIEAAGIQKEFSTLKELIAVLNNMEN
ncbi:MAG TPA: ABC transporter ATP-binding protein [Cyclobacteriaceae bacterium]|nr:ABC transporter ATP-binding protein [Cyclobacteriaceae bacterium]HNU41986.1 ABC transporter ATP-binding protein [Cyclobacteriaceae bacterium]